MGLLGKTGQSGQIVNWAGEPNEVGESNGVGCSSLSEVQVVELKWVLPRWVVYHQLVLTSKEYMRQKANQMLADVVNEHYEEGLLPSRSELLRAVLAADLNLASSSHQQGLHLPRTSSHNKPYIIDNDSEDEVASVDNKMTSFLASKKVGYGTNSLLEQ
ncbi:hypothetical protein Tco_1023935 [Tanacetum coccineum]